MRSVLLRLVLFVFAISQANASGSGENVTEQDTRQLG
jgi:hypothetical protein